MVDSSFKFDMVSIVYTLRNLDLRVELTKGCFTLWLSVEWTKDSIVIPGEQKFVRSPLHTKGQQPKDNTLQNVHMETLVVSFGTKSLSGGEMFVHNIYGNSNSSLVDKYFFQTNTNATN
jgi:hypothetical protein